MKTKIQMMLGLLFIAITISLIAFSVGWYTISTDDIFKAESSTTASTTNVILGGEAALEIAGCLIKLEDGIYDVSEYVPYRGQTGLNSDEYIILFKTTSDELYGTEAYVNLCETNKYGVINYTKAESEFRAFLVNYTPGAETCVIDNSDVPHQYLAVSFGNGINEFVYSDIEDLGITFRLNVFLDYSR